MSRSFLTALLFVVSLGAFGVAHAENVPADPHDRVAYHLRELEQLSGHFETVLASECPRFASPEEWKGYFDGEVDRVVLLLAHLEQAWIEAKRSPDDDLRRTAKAPRKRVDQARALVGKLQRCADENGTNFEPMTMWRRVEREVPRRQTEIALPRQ